MFIITILAKKLLRSKTIFMPKSKLVHKTDIQIKECPTPIDKQQTVILNGTTCSEESHLLFEFCPDCNDVIILIKFVVQRIINHLNHVSVDL